MFTSQSLSRTLVALLVLLLACAGGATGVPAQATTVAAAPMTPMVQAAKSLLLVDGTGHTLYVYTKDTAGKASACTGGCAKYWPPLLVPAGTTAPTTVAGVSGAFGTISRSDGTTQVTYQGWPLYTWIKDTQPGQVTGQAVAGTWWAALASAAPVKAAAATGTMSTTAPLVQAAQSTMLVDGKGHTLYMFTADTAGKASACSGGCAHAWPPLLVPAGTTAPTTVAGVSGAFGTISRSDGTTQVTYEGWPLYTWFKDKKPGDMTGQAVGGTWWALAATPPAPQSITSTLGIVQPAKSLLLVDGTGHTLYVYTKDTAGKASACTGGCAKYWPPLLVPAGTTAPTTVAGVSGAFGTISRSDGTTQVTYQGWPLYTWIKDTQPGQVTGQAVAGTWWAALASAAPVKAAAATGTMSTTAPLVQAAQSTMLVDGKGHTLYMFTADTAGKASACSGGCAHAWPPLLVPAGTTAPTTVAGVSGAFGTISRSDGTTQVTYEGWPLYTWFKDKKPGDMTGQAVGGTWWALAAAPPTVK